MKFKKQQKIKRNKGSILIGVILLFIMIVSISAAVVSRSFHGSILATDSKKGYSAYQASDTNAEKILNDVKILDSKNDGTIPENTDYRVYCTDKCYKQNGSTVLVSGDKVSDIYFIEKKGDAQSATRAVNVSMLDRVENPVSDLKVTSDSRNRCDAKFSLTYDGATADTWKKISNLELRKSSTSGSSLEKDSWKKLADSTIDNSNTTKTIKNSEFDYNKTYYFSLKAKNKNPLALDSLYYNKNEVKFDSPSINCEKDSDDSEVLGCLSSAKGAHNPGSYACCNGTECYVCGSDWSKDSDASGLCCTQNAPPDVPCSCGASSITYTRHTCATVTSVSVYCGDCPPLATTTLKK